MSESESQRETQKENRRTLERKSTAQQLARAATEAIADRKLRALAKADVYGHILPLLEDHYGAQRKLHRTYRRLLAWTCGAFLLAAATAILLGRELLSRAA